MMTLILIHPLSLSTLANTLGDSTLGRPSAIEINIISRTLRLCIMFLHSTLAYSKVIRALCNMTERPIKNVTQDLFFSRVHFPTCLSNPDHAISMSI